MSLKDKNNNNLTHKQARGTTTANGSNQVIGPKGDKGCKIVLSTEETIFSEILREVRKGVDPGAMGVEVKNIFKSKKGEVILTVGGDLGQAKVFVTRTSQKGNFLLITGMDEVTNVVEF